MIKDYTKVKGENIENFITENFGKITGTLSAENPHWWLHFYHDKVCYLYRCCDSEYCDSQDWIEYHSAEQLIADQKYLDGGDWWWEND